jgi:hypothetical protein
VDHSLIIQGRQIGPAELGQVRGLLSAHPDWSRSRFSRELCQVWKWRNPVGQIKEMATRSLLLKLEEQGWVVRPVRRCFSPTISEGPRRSLQGAFIPRDGRAGTDFSARNDGNLEMLAGKQKIVFV